jgi:predicted nucleic acid-binding protein
MKVLLDTNVVLDLMLKREPWLAAAQGIWQANRDGRLEGCLTGSSLTDLYYIIRRIAGVAIARRGVRECLDAFGILPTDEVVLDLAYSLENNDFEDAVQIVTAEREHLDAIITRDAKGFAGSPVPALSPMDLVSRLQADS